MLKKIFKGLVHIFAIIGLLLTILIIIVWCIVPKKERVYAEIKFDMYVPDRTDTIHRTLCTRYGFGHVVYKTTDDYYQIRSIDGDNIIWKDKYPIFIVSQKEISESQYNNRNINK